MKKYFINAIKAILNTISADTKNQVEIDTRKALEDTLKEAEASPDEMDAKSVENMIADKLKAASSANDTAVANMQKNLMNEITKRLKGKKSVKNAYLKSGKAMTDFYNCVKGSTQAEFHNKWKAKLKENGIEIQNDIDPNGVLLPVSVVQAITDGLSKSGKLFPLLNHTGLKAITLPINYMAEDLDTSSAGRHVKGETKAVQVLDLDDKKIVAQAIFKLLPVDYETIRQCDDEAALLKYIANELADRWYRIIEKTILVGDNRVSTTRKITSYEPIVRAATDDFVTVINGTSSAQVPTIEQVKDAVDSIDSEGRLILVINKKTRTALQKFIAATGGTTQYRRIEDIAGELGVDEIIVDRNVNYQNGALAILMDRDAYLCVGDKTPESIYQYDIQRNQHNYEMVGIGGGGVGKLKSAAFVKYVQ